MPNGSTTGELRAYEAQTLRPRWDWLTQDAEAKAGVLNWEQAPRESWHFVGATSYAGMVRGWAPQVTRVLELAGGALDQDLVSLQRGLQFHLGKLQFLQSINLADVEPRSAIERLVGVGGPSDIATGLMNTGEAIDRGLPQLGGWRNLVLVGGLLLLLGFLLYGRRR